MIIRNRDELLSHGHIEARRTALDIIDSAMEAIDASSLTRNLVQRRSSCLEVGPLKFDLSTIGDIYVLGAGKAVLQMAEALDDILGDRIKAGFVIEKYLNGMKKGRERIHKFRNIKVFEGSHPIPDNATVQAARELLELAKAAKRGDLVIFCVQGGCSCLTTVPAGGLSLEDLQQTTDLLLNSGLEIKTANSVRIALTRLSGGRLAKYIYPAEIINLVVNDVVWSYRLKNEYSFGWGPTVPLSSARQDLFKQSIDSLKSHRLWGLLPERVKNHMLNLDASLIPPTAEDLERSGVIYHTFVLASPEDGAEAAEASARQMGCRSFILSSAIEGEARDVGSVYGAIAKEIARCGRPLAPPCVVIAAGETTVTISGQHGEGGRNQEAALSAALKIDGAMNVAILSVGTDGTDGPSDIAGGIVDGYSIKRAKEKGINIEQELNRHNSSHVFRVLGDAILFDEPGNNVCDLSLVVVTQC
jgi:glycerate-2-kinase